MESYRYLIIGAGPSGLSFAHALRDWGETSFQSCNMYPLISITAPNAVESKAHWTYEPDESLSYHRVLYRTNFCKGSRGYWTETNSRRSVPIDMWRYRNEYAYPLNTRDKPETIKKILSWAEQHSIIGLGRWGKWEHMNSDEAVSQAVTAAKTLVRAEMPK